MHSRCCRGRRQRLNSPSLWSIPNNKSLESIQRHSSDRRPRIAGSVILSTRHIITRHFMQPRSSPLDQDVDTNIRHPAKGDPTTQHGLDQSSTPLSAPPGSSESDGAGSGSNQCDADTVLPHDGSVTLQSSVQGLRLSPPPAPSPGSRNRVAEYENASRFSTPKKAETLGFEVIKKNRKPGDKRAPILELPNGMLPLTCDTRQVN